MWAHFYGEMTQLYRVRKIKELNVSVECTIMPVYKCKDCNYKTKSETEHYEHYLSKEHWDIFSQTNLVYDSVCHACDYGTDNVDEWNKHCMSEGHLESQKYGWMCACGRACNMLNDLIIHRESCRHLSAKERKNKMLTYEQVADGLQSDLKKLCDVTRANMEANAKIIEANMEANAKNMEANAKAGAKILKVYREEKELTESRIKGMEKSMNEDREIIEKLTKTIKVMDATIELEKRTNQLAQHPQITQSTHSENTTLGAVMREFSGLKNVIYDLKQTQELNERQTCQFCYYTQDQTKRLEKYKDKNDDKEYKICQECCFKSTGYHSTRSELIVTEHLKNNYHQPILSTNKQVNGNACLPYQPDVVYADPTRATIVEIDEKGHNKNSYLCDQKRMSDVFDEFGGLPNIWIRFNPDKYPGGTKSMSERLDELVALLHRIEKMTFDPQIYIFYMYYDPSWRSVSKDLNVEFIY